MENSGMNAILDQLRATSTLASGIKKQEPENEAIKVDFGETLKAAVDKTNNLQLTAQQMTQDFVSGENDTDLHEVMISLQKANITFQTTVQVRNKLVTAYQEIMNMQV
ncbi:MAG: flagellar hook-basal body complex protein FliE [Nitrosomonas sp.]|nr:flagellar hook-basal body complex protein FliE [Nitrosomonas sp.]